MNQKGNAGIAVLVAIGIITAVGIGISVRYYTQTRQIDIRSPQENSQQPIIKVPPEDKLTSQSKAQSPIKISPTTKPVSTGLKTSSLPIALKDDYQKLITSSTSWVIVFTHRGNLLPENIINFICNSVKSSVISWLDREFSKYDKQRPFNEIICYQNQILLPPETLSGGEMAGGEGVTFINPINSKNVIEFLENRIPSISEIKYVTVFHYLIPTELKFTNYQYSPKYDFEFITSYTLPDGNIAFIPPINQVISIGDYAQELIHEFMHKIGATDKYSVDPKQACLINPETGQQYSGYDIMCHRVPMYSAFATPSIMELIITIPTSRELK